MKRLVSLIVILAIVASVAVGLAATQNVFLGAEATIAVIADMHIVSDSYFDNEQLHLEYKNQYKMQHLSEAISKTMVDKIIYDKKIKTVLVAGDITENGDIQSHYAAVRILKKLQDAGKQVLVVNGNHDTQRRPHQTKATPQEFQEIYWDFGYSEALVSDSDSLSYTADINKKYRLIAIDNDNHYSEEWGHKQEVNQNLIDWVEAQLEQCKKDGVTPIALAHKPIVSHFSETLDMMISALSSLLGKSEHLINNKDLLANVLADNGCHYIFTGHLHSMDISIHTSPNGKKLFDIETGTTLSLPVGYRKVKYYKNKVEFRTQPIEKLNMEYTYNLEDYEHYDLIEQDFPAYAQKHLIQGIGVMVMETIEESLVDSIPATFEDIFMSDIVIPFFTGGIYHNPDGLSLQEIVTQHGGQPISPSDYNNLIEVAAYLYRTLSEGDERVPQNSVEVEILIKSVMSLFYYIDLYSDELEEMLTGSPKINIDLDRLFSQGSLEMIDSNLVKFAVHFVGGSLPNWLNLDNMQNLSVIKMFLPSIAESFIPGVGDALEDCIGSTDILLEKLLRDVVIGIVLADALHDDYPGDNNVTISRDTHEPL